MTNRERVTELMREMAQGTQAAGRSLVYRPETRRLEVAGGDQVVRKDRLNVTPEDMKVSAWVWCGEGVS